MPIGPEHLNESGEPARGPVTILNDLLDRLKGRYPILQSLVVRSMTEEELAGVALGKPVPLVRVAMRRHIQASNRLEPSDRDSR